MPNPISLRKWNPFRSRRAIVVAVIVVALLGCWIVSNLTKSATVVTSNATVVVTRGTLIARVTGSGTVAAERSLDLSFPNGGTVTEVIVKAGDTVTAGATLVRLDDRLLQSQVINAQAGLASAQARLKQSQQGNARPGDLAAAQAAVTSAQAAYDAAVQSAGTTTTQLVAARAAELKAEVAVAQAQGDYDQVSWRPDIGMLPQAQALQNATIDYDQAKANYDTLLKTAIPNANSTTQSAAATLEQAKTTLTNLTAPATDTDLAIQQAAVAQAEQSLKQAQLNLEGATLKAPFAGLVTSVDVITGSPAGAGTKIGTMMDRSTLHVDLRLNENDVTRVQPDQPVTVTIDSLVGWSAQGKVTFVAPASDVINGVVTYQVRVSFADTDPRVKVGMTTNLEIVTARKDNVLLVPNSALLPSGAGHVVQIPAADGKLPGEASVVTGLTDGVMTEIISGVNEGDKIVAAPQPKRQGGLFGGG